MSSRAYKPSLYPDVPRSNPDSSSPFVSNPNYPPDPPPPSSSSSSSSNLYPSLDMKDLHENLFPDPTYGYDPSSHRGGPGRDAAAAAAAGDDPRSPSTPPDSSEEVLLRVPGAILHLIDKEYSVELGCGDFSLIALRQGENAVAVLARVADEAQWPLTKDGAAVKVDDSHYFFSLRALEKAKSGSDSSDDEGKKGGGASDDPLNYGLTFASKGQEGLLRELDAILEKYSAFSIQKVSRKAPKGEALDATVAKETSPAELQSGGKKKEIMEDKCRAYWTTLAPNVEDYSGTTAKLIAAGSGQLIKGILWCGDVTVDRLNWGNEVMKKRMTPAEKAEIDKKTLKRLKRAKKMTRMTEKVATGVLSGVVRVSGFVTSSVANSSAGKKFFGLLPGELVLASLDGFNKVCDAVEVAGRNVMATSSTVTTGLVSHRYGEEAGKATHEGLHAAGHAMGTAWAVFKIRKAFNPKSVIKPSTIAKSAAKAAAAEAKAKSKKSK